MTLCDQMQRFTFDDTDIRGEIVHLNQTQADALSHHHYPEPVREVLSQLMAATALLSATLKFDGRITLQIRPQGAVSLLQAESTQAGSMRAIARFDASALETIPFDPKNLGDGTLVITIEPDQGQRYQGITSLNHGTLAHALEQYFEQSEQLPSRFILSASNTCAAGMMLQQLPGNHRDDPDAWNRLTLLLNTLTEEELLTLDDFMLLHRLFHEECVRTYPAQHFKFECSCSKARIAAAIKPMGREELNDMIKEQSVIKIDCDFCFQNYVFDQQDINDLFANDTVH